MRIFDPCDTEHKADHNLSLIKSKQQQKYWRILVIVRRIVCGVWKEEEEGSE